MNPGNEKIFPILQETVYSMFNSCRRDRFQIYRDGYRRDVLQTHRCDDHE